MDRSLVELIQNDNFIPILAVGGGLVVAVIAIVFGAVRAMVVGTAREKTRQELAAYVASGALDADKAIAIMNAGGRFDKNACV